MRAKLLPLIVALVLAPGLRAGQEIDEPIGPVADFALKDRAGETVIRRDDLLGKVWVASFILAACPDGKCPQVSQTVARLQRELANRKDVRFVSFVLDPQIASSAVLAKYAAAHDADPERWLFLTGDKEQLDAVQQSFFVLVKGEQGKDFPPHSQRLFVVDRQGRFRDFYDGMPPFADDPEFERGLRRLKRRVDQLLAPDLPAWLPKDFPAFNATLNAVSACLLLLGYSAIRRRLVKLHVACMLAAIAVSALFLTTYLFFHLYVKGGQPTRFAEQAPGAPAWVGYLYHAVLITHTILAIPTAPLALITAYLGLRGWLKSHIGLARWTLPVWLYVSTTGVVVYLMLYRLYPS